MNISKFVSLLHVWTGSKEEKQALITKCYKMYFSATDINNFNEFYHAVCKTVECFSPLSFLTPSVCVCFSFQTSSVMNEKCLCSLLHSVVYFGRRLKKSPTAVKENPRIKISWKVEENSKISYRSWKLEDSFNEDWKTSLKNVVFIYEISFDSKLSIKKCRIYSFNEQ